MENPDKKLFGDLPLKVPGELKPDIDWAGETLIHDTPKKVPTSIAEKNKFEISKEIKERKEFEGIKRVVVKGSIAFALKSGKDLGLARDIDIFFVEEGMSSEVSIQNFQNLKQAKERLTPQEYSTIEGFVSGHSLGHLSIHVVKASESHINDVALFRDEPEVVLWDSWLGLNSDLLKPISKEEKDSLTKKIDKELGGGVFSDGYLKAQELKKQLKTAHDVHLYESGKLITGDMPSYIEPQNESLAAVLRLVDLGKRFKIGIDDSVLRTADYEISNDRLKIKIPSEDEEINLKEGLAVKRDDEDEENSDSYFGKKRRRRFFRSRSEVLDQAFYNVAHKKDLFGLIEDQYPNLAELVKRIQAAGGIREFVKKVYGEGYLNKDSMSLNSYKFTEREKEDLSPAEQVLTLNIWENSNYRFQQIFNNSFETFLDKFVTSKEKVSFGGESLARVQELMLRAQMESDLESGDPKKRQAGYLALANLAEDYKHKGLESAESYQAIKTLIKDKISEEKNKPLRKILVDALVNLGQDGIDMTIVNDFAEVLKKESTGIKSRKSEKKEILSSEGMTILRGLFNMGHEDAIKAVFELVANPAVDPRLKKLCLKNLHQEKGIFPRKLGYYVDEDLYSISGEINWGDYEALYKIKRISSSHIRADVEAYAQNAFIDIRSEKRSIASVNEELAPSLGSEFFLPLYKLLGHDAERLKKWDRFVSEIKSNKQRESFLYSVANILKYDLDLVNLITDRIIDSPKITKEHIALAGRLLKKIHSLVFFREKMRGSSIQAVPDNEEIKTMITEMKAPSLLEVRLDERIVSGLYEITGRGDLSSDRIQTIFNAWEDPEPVFIFASQLARSRGSESGARSMNLMGEMLANMDPPDLKEWKQWRYHNEDSFTKEQLKNLSPEQIESYAEDEFTDLGEVMVGLLPSDKPRRIQEEIIHALRHDWHDSEDNLLLQHANKLLSAANMDGPIDFESATKTDLENIDIQLNIIDRKINLEDDLQTLERLPQQLEHWQRNEEKKRESLVAMGLRGNETREEVEDKIRELKQEQPNSKDIMVLAGLKPTELPTKIKKFLDRYNLASTVDLATLDQLKVKLQGELNEVNSSPTLQSLGEALPKDGEKISIAQWQEAIKKIKAAQIILRLGNLTPQLIAFNKLTPGKKKTTLKTALEYLKRNFKENNSLMTILEHIESIINEASHPVGKDRLAVVFTDNPMAMLTIGKFPHGATSCQNYESGDSVLAAYMSDAYTKMCLLIDMNKLSPEVNKELEVADDSDTKMRVFNSHSLSFLNAAVGRRLTKIVQDYNDGQPKLFLEPVYTPLDRESTSRLLNAFAVTHLESKLGIPLVRGGGSGEVYVPESRNGSQYEDGESGGPGGGGGGLGTQGGSYKMPAQPLQKKDFLIAA